MTAPQRISKERQVREAGFREALQSLYQQVGAWAATGLLGPGVVAQESTMTLMDGPAGPFETERLLLSAGQTVLALEPSTLTPPGADGEVRLVGAGARPEDVLRLGKRGAWTCGPLSQAPGVPLDPDILRHLLRGEGLGG